MDEEERGSPTVEEFSRGYVHVTAYPVVVEKDDYGRSVDPQRRCFLSTFCTCRRITISPVSGARSTVTLTLPVRWKSQSNRRKARPMRTYAMTGKHAVS
jgi:hypothetical protein